MQRLWAPWRMEYVGRDAPEEGCVLCAIGEGGGVQAEHVVERAELTYTVLNRYPYASGHLMVVPFRHTGDLVELSDDEGAALHAGTRRAVLALRRAMRPQGFNIGVNLGRGSGAGILDHVHLHVVPRWEGDTNFMTVLADVRVLPEHLDAVAARLREAYAEL